MSAPDARQETRSMLESIDRWENEGGRGASHATTAASPLGMRMSALERTCGAASRDAGRHFRSSEHASWQERGLVKHIEQRFGLPPDDLGEHPTRERRQGSSPRRS
jgi:hypothetical protein